MLVILKRDFFGPDNVLYSKHSKGTEVPDEFKDKLPRDAKVHDGKKFVSKNVPIETLRDADIDRANGEGVDKAKAEANEVVRREKALALKKQLEVEKK